MMSRAILNIKLLDSQIYKTCVIRVHFRFQFKKRKKNLWFDHKLLRNSISDISISDKLSVIIIFDATNQ
jgi:hypothetical protein